MSQPDQPKDVTSALPATGGAAAIAGGDSIQVTLPGRASSAERWLWRGLILVLCLLAYVPSFSPEFLWDDERHAASRMLADKDALERIWTKWGLVAGGTPQYYPLTHTTFWLEYQVFGRNAIGYRVVNVLLHAGCAVMLWELLRRLRVPGAFLAAAVFAVHPMMVESVAWTSERKNTLSLILGLTAIWAYAGFAGLRAEDEAEPEASAGPDWNLLVIAALAFVGAMLSKTMAASVPVMIVLMLWWKRKLTIKHCAFIAPMLALAVYLGLVTAFIEHKHVIRPPAGSVQDTMLGFIQAKLSGNVQAGDDFKTSFDQRLLLAGIVPWFYGWQLFVPVKYVFFYPRWDLAGAPAWWWLAHVGLLGALIGAGVAALRGVRWPAVVALGYLVALFPAMGFIDVYPFRYSFVADHFAYHASWILLAAAAAGVATLATRTGLTKNAPAVLGAGAVLCVLLGARTYLHAGHFIDKYAMWTHVVANNPTNWAATHNLAVEHIQFANKSEQVRRQAIERKEDKLAAEAEKERTDNLAKAEELLKRTLVLKPDHDFAHHVLGEVYFQQRRYDEALTEFRTSAENRAKDPEARDGPLGDTFQRIGDLLAMKGDLAGAASNYRQAIATENPPLRPRQARWRLALLRTELRILKQEQQAAAKAGKPRVEPSAAKVKELIAVAQEVTTMTPESYEGWLLSGDLAFEIGQFNDATVAYRAALQLRETDDALVGLGTALLNLGRFDIAMVAFEDAVKKNPNRTDAKRFVEVTREFQQRATTRAATRAATTQPTTVPAR